MFWPMLFKTIQAQDAKGEIQTVEVEHEDGEKETLFKIKTP